MSLEDAGDRLLAMSVDDPSGCRVWMHGKTTRGYGVMRVAGRSRMAHRVSYELSIGYIPIGMHVCHTCDNPSCVNPRHLFLGTAADNMTDKTNKGRAARKLTPGAVYDIRRRLSLGHRQVDIAASHGVSQVVVSEIKLGRIWRHV